MYGRLKNTTFEENVETSHIFGKIKKNIYSFFFKMCSFYNIYLCLQDKTLILWEILSKLLSRVYYTLLVCGFEFTTPYPILEGGGGGQYANELL